MSNVYSLIILLKTIECNDYYSHVITASFSIYITDVVVCLEGMKC